MEGLGCGYSQGVVNAHELGPNKYNYSPMVVICGPSVTVKTRNRE